ncbi:hypothetical protein CJ010_13805 [Azoarcus sp. DD4]|uniref:GspH/FimT family pseudopilin n=1 Tax=Azoarcus sp. DD4 TaxID=2027405 RepID=UPI00112D1979|nr:GspH/FimT family pseudopilin [Azoarcus sp. DD4]QDF97533.1 hypothetical protein CJ010_13805 [Azoarcus sp. DD4]
MKILGLTPRMRSGGFSLVELMVVIALLGIAMAIATPSFTRMIADQRVRAAATDFHTAMLQARSLAITHNLNVTVEPNDAGWEAGWSVHPESGASPVYDQGGVSAGVTVSGGDAGVTFTPSGRVKAAAALTVTSDSDNSLVRCVRVELTGRPVTEAGACT